MSRRHLNVVDSSPVAPVPSPSLWDESQLLQVGELARATGKTVRAIHLYEDLGLISPVRRSKGRYRLFAPDAQLRIRWIGKLQSLGLSLGDIQALVEQRHASDSARRAAAELRQVYADKLAEVTETIERYRALQVELQESLAFLDACQSACQGHADWTSCPSCERHGSAREGAPELIAGAQFVSEPS
jgi:MerR family transcriptional regulator, copper efflux regulator